METSIAKGTIMMVPRDLRGGTPLPQRWARALRWAKRVAASRPDLTAMKVMLAAERQFRQG